MRFSCQILSGFITCQKSLKSVSFDRVIKKIKGGRFSGHGVVFFVDCSMLVHNSCELATNVSANYQRAHCARCNHSRLKTMYQLHTLCPKTLKVTFLDFPR